MPTTKTTLTETQIPLKGTIPVTMATALSSLPTSATKTLQTLYKRAAPAFLRRDFSLTQSLIESAFAVLLPPDVVPDGLEEPRRKWDILRITLESTIYSSPLPPETLPQTLKGNQLQSPQTWLAALHRRSLNLFSPVNENSTTDPVYLPSQVLVTLVYSSLRLDCPDVGRVMIEEWLARRDPIFQDGAVTGGGYEKVLELYCLQILPRLELWDYAHSYLEHERELHASVRESFKTSLRILQTEAMSSRQPHHTASSSSAAAGSYSWSNSLAPSSSSSSSSLSTTSTNTVVPPTARSAQHPHTTIIPSTSTNVSTISLSSGPAATPRPMSRRPVLGSRTRKSSPTSLSSDLSSFPRSSPHEAALRPTAISIYSLVKASLAPLLTTSNISTFFLIFIFFPLVSLVLRARHRRRKAVRAPGDIHSNVESARRRLKRAGGLGVLGSAWGEVVSVVRDAVRMAGSGSV